LLLQNTKGQLVAIAAKSTKALILNAALGAGSEMIIDVAPGVDWTAILACMMAIQQARVLGLTVAQPYCQPRPPCPVLGHGQA
jgi:hypothetical protein